MAEVIVYLPDALHDAATGAGLRLSEICREAVEVEVNRLPATEAAPRAAAFTRPTPRRLDEGERFREGMELGMHWARHAPTHEVAEIASWGSLRWRQFAVDPARNSLPRAVCEANGFSWPANDREYWFERDAYIAGVVEGVAAAGRKG